jgi:multicomponent Na+:H+ antiporter subunit D
MAGTLDLVALANRAGEAERGMPHLGAALLFAAISVKLGLFPFHGWVPALYSHALPPVAAALSGALINVGAYALLRFGFLSAQTARAEGATVLIVLGAATIVYGALVAARRTVPAETAAYAAIAQAGYVVLAVGIGGRAGAAAGLLAVLAGSVEKTALFLGLESTGPARRAATLAAGLGLAGLPLTLGFLAKIALVRATLAVPGGWLPATAVIVATALLMVGVIRYADAMRRLPAPSRHGGIVPGLMGLTTVGLALPAAPLDALVQTLVDDLLGGGGR